MWYPFACVRYRPGIGDVCMRCAEVRGTGSWEAGITGVEGGGVGGVECGGGWRMRSMMSFSKDSL